MARAKTMFASSVCCSDRFSELSFEAQALYYRLNLEADGVGALNNVKTVMRAAGFAETALDELMRAGFVLEITDPLDPFLLIADFWINNNLDKTNIRKSEHIETVLSKCCFQSERVKRYRLVKGDSDCEQSGFSLGSVLFQTGNSPEKKRKERNRKEPKRMETAISAPTPCPDCGRPCAAVAEGSHLHGECPAHGDFFIDLETGELHG